MRIFKDAFDAIGKVVGEFADSSQKEENSNVKKENTAAWYAEWNDNYLINIIDNPITKSCLQNIADYYYSKQIQEVIKQSSLLVEDNYPSLHAVLKDCCHKLRLSNIPDVYITGRLKGINALSLEINKKQLILVSRSVAIRLNQKEQSFLLGHELGHIQQGNLVCHTISGLLNEFSKSTEILGPILADMINVPLNNWKKYSEFNADRAGFICCGDISCIHNLFKTVYDVPLKTKYSVIAEMYQDHPFIKSRLDRILKFANSVRNKKE